MAPAALILNFTEVVNASSIIYSGLTLLSSSGGTGTSYNLISSFPATPYSKDVIIILSNEDLQGLTDAYPIGAFTNSTFLSLKSSAVQDVSGVMANSVTTL